MTACARCGDPTEAIHRLCHPCVEAKTRAECEAQGVPFAPTEEQMARFGRIAQSAAASRGAA